MQKYLISALQHPHGSSTNVWRMTINAYSLEIVQIENEIMTLFFITNIFLYGC